ncbi:polypeptide N-acetylgalactosaminyltransferase 11-like [Styela clava]
MLHGTRREVALCFTLLIFVVTVTIYLTVFSLHGSSAAIKIQLKAKLSEAFRPEEELNDFPTRRLVTSIPQNEFSINQTVKYASDGGLPVNAGEVLSDSQRQYHKQQQIKHAFNVLISDRIGPVARPVPDTRHEICHKKSYSNISVSASVIVCFHKEAFSALVRTVASVIERTPPQLLQELILVDDFSDNEEENEKLVSYLEQHYPYGKVRVIHAEARLGLIGARLMGAKEASGDVLVFLDSHCEPNVGWIEPLLDIVQMNRSTVVCPVVDIINSMTMSYIASPVLRGGFNWGLHFSWEDLPYMVEDPSEPFASPTMAGGLFAINRMYFKEIGYYDEDMKEWGGENLELSFRLWMCGGRLLIAPCSRVGHIFRRRRPNSIQEVDNPTRNAARVAAVWLDNHKTNFLEKRTTAKKLDYGDISSRVKLRKDLKCHDFDWYLNNIYPEIEIPGKRKSKIKYYRPTSMDEWKNIKRGHIKVTDLDLCLQSDEEKGSLIVATKCDPTSSSQLWRMSGMGEIKFGSESRLCMDAGSSENPRLMKCNGEEGTQSWSFFPRDNFSKHGEITGRLYSASEGLCLQLSGGDLKEEEYELIMQICSSPSVQTFTMQT